MKWRMEQFGRYEFDPQGSGINDIDIWSQYMGPFYEYATADPDGFLTELRAVVADDRGGFATFGAARLVWEMFSDRCLQIPGALPLVDAGIDFKIARGLDGLRMTGYEQQRLHERGDQVG
jgi:hypothetical protein